MQKASMRERALRVVLSGVMVVGLAPIAMVLPTIVGAEQAQVALAADEQSTTIVTVEEDKEVYTQDGFTVMYLSGAVNDNGGAITFGVPMVIRSTTDATITKVELTVGYFEQNSNEVTTTKGTLSGNTSGSTCITCSDINDKAVAFETSNDDYLMIKSVKVYYEPAGQPVDPSSEESAGGEGEVEHKLDATVTTPTTVTAWGQDATFACATNAEGATYAWQWSKDGGETWKACTVGEATGPAYSIAAKQYRAGYLYRCTVTDADGDAITSNACGFDLAVPAATATVEHAAEVGGYATLTCEVDGRAIGYHWQWRKTSTGKWYWCTTDTAANPFAQTISVKAKSYRAGYEYRCVVTLPDDSTTRTNSVTLF